MEDISGIGLSVTVHASVTFPQSFTVTSFADDVDPFDNADFTIAESAMGLNGDLVVWSTPNPIEVILNVIPNSDDDNNLEILLDTNRSAKNKLSVRDIITMIADYGDGTKKVLTNGRIVSGSLMSSVSSTGRLKTKGYRFVFENKVS